jgi:hypothetical protein
VRFSGTFSAPRSHSFVSSANEFQISGKNGIAINLVDSEKSMQLCKSIEKHFDKKIVLLDAENSDEIEKIGS